MNVAQQGIIMLLKSAITGEELALPEGFDIEAAYPQIKRHHMITMIYDGAVRCGVSRQTPVMQKLFQSYCKAMLVSEGQMREIGRIFAAFDENGVDYMPLKGSKMKALYPKPELRIMGDADILIRMEQYEKIIPIMESLGFTAKLESDHELIWQSDSLYLELHKRLIPSYNEDFYAYFGDGWQMGKCKDGTRYSMTTEDEFIYLFTHFAKHFRDGGIGCRHVVDLWVYLRANPDMNEAMVRAELEKLQLLDFYGNIRRLIAVWFEDVPTDDKIEFITEFVFASGSWGQMGSGILSQAVKNAKHSMPGVSGRMQYILEHLFPSVEGVREKYTILKKAPWLLPAVWVYRPFYKLLVEPKTLKQHGKNLDTLSQENLETRQHLLNYVGLDYNF